DNLFTDKTTTVVVNNVAPTAKMANTGPILEGGRALVGLLGAGDPSLVDTVAGFHYSFALDASALATTYDQAAPSYWAGFTFAATGAHVVHGRVFDKDTGFTDYTTTVVVKKATVLSGVSGSSIYGGQATLTALLTADGAPLDGKPVTFHLFIGGSDVVVG